jgi:type III restriction enzyme
MITLFQFQETAAAQIAERVAGYLSDPISAGRGAQKHTVPCFQALSAITGAGKTVILAEAVSHIAAEMPVPPVILWLSKRDVVVAQSFANLAEGGKYHHLLDNMSVALLVDYDRDAVLDADHPLVYFATVGTFNQKDKQDGTLRIFKSQIDSMEQSTWTALTERLDSQGRRRPLIVMYDEGQNLSDQQTDLLLDLQPDLFLLASATMRIPPRLDQELKVLQANEFTADELVTKVLTPLVVGEGLVKSQVSLEGYNSPMEETLAAMISALDETEAEAVLQGVNFRPKAIYVSDTNVVASNPTLTDDPKQPFAQRQAPPIQIWRYLTEQCGVDPNTIAVYANLKVNKDYPLPDDFVLFSGGDKDYENFTAGDYQHIIFNQRLQEGWDDPSVYFAYVDKSMNSTTQITQVIGRVLRQPDTTHYPSDLLNTARFYVRVDKNEVFTEVIQEVERELGTEPGGIQISVRSPGKPQMTTYPAQVEVTVPRTGINSQQAVGRVHTLLDQLPDFRQDSVNTRGEGSRRVVTQKVGADADATTWETFEQSSTASARWIFHREVQRKLSSALGVVNLAEPKLDATVGIGSSAFHMIRKLADDVVDAYVQSARLSQRRPNPYIIGSMLARPDQVTEFKHAVHTGYAGLRPEEMRFAQALDGFGMRWTRNPDRTGYGIPLVTPGPTKTFYPDFLLWTALRVVCIDTKGPHLIRETAARKLLSISYPGEGPRLDIQFVSLGRHNERLERRDSEGCTAWSIAPGGEIQAQHFEELPGVVEYLADDKIHVPT